MSTAAREHLIERFELADQLYFGRANMEKPQDLPGRYGRVVRAIDHLLQAIKCPAVLGGGWAVWFHGFEGRLTLDVDILLPAAQIQEFMLAASVSGFEVLPQKPGRWPKLIHKETGIKVDIMPEGERPGTAAKPAPTTLPHPSAAGAVGDTLNYTSLPSLIELKLAAGRPHDETDVIKLILANPTQIEIIRKHLGVVHPDYLAAFDRLAERVPEYEEP